MSSGLACRRHHRRSALNLTTTLIGCLRAQQARCWRRGPAEGLLWPISPAASREQGLRTLNKAFTVPENVAGDGWRRGRNSDAQGALDQHVDQEQGKPCTADEAGSARCVCMASAYACLLLACQLRLDEWHRPTTASLQRASACACVPASQLCACASACGSTAAPQEVCSQRVLKDRTGLPDAGPDTAQVRRSAPQTPW